ncbi:MAG: DUF1365 domain-containing protein [Alphaproteobacteria bacterium]|nr:DUF1365 domain-containing protein [Alphaproteobacteria bacterium]
MDSFVPMTVMHHRLSPKVNRFFYKTFYLCLDVSSLNNLNNILLGFEKFRPFSLRHKDYGFQDGTTIQRWLSKVTNTYGLSHEKVYLVTMPRVLGYGFNPISFWLFLDENSKLQAVIADVNNTFGENHQYFIRDKKGGKLSSKKVYQAEKLFHVSPFMPVEGTYSFRFMVPEDMSQECASLGFWIDYSIDGQKMLLTSLNGKLKSLSERMLLRALITYPFMTIMVVWRIHYQAFKLWMKGIKYYSKPKPPKEKTTE